MEVCLKIINIDKILKQHTSRKLPVINDNELIQIMKQL